MKSLEIQRVNYESDFTLMLKPVDAEGNATDAFPSGDFEIVFTCGGRKYSCSRKGDRYTNCRLNDDGTLTVVFDSHNLLPGVLRMKMFLHLPNALYPDGEQTLVGGCIALGVELVACGGDDFTTEFEAELVMPCQVDIRQEEGQETAAVMSQKAVTDALAVRDAATKNFAVSKDLVQPTCAYLSSLSVNSIGLSDKQVELLEARDVISVEICVSDLNRNNLYNKTIAPRYFSITLGDKSLGSSIKCRYDGVPNYRGCGVTNRPSNWQNLVHGITNPCGYNRWIMVLDRKKGRIALYDRPGSLIQEETDETLFKSDSWFGGVKSLGISADFAANLFGLRIYDHDISVIHKADNQFLEQEVFGENLLPYHYPRYYNESINRQDIIYDKDHWLINSVSKYPRPYNFGVLSKMYKDDEGLHMISDKVYAANDKTTRFSCATYQDPTPDLSTKSVFIATFRVVTGSVRANVNGLVGENYLVGSGITDTDGNVYTTSDILGPGTYTMEFMASPTSVFCGAAEANTEIVLIKTEIYLPRLVISLDFHTVFKNKVYDAVWDKWYESKATDGYPTNVVSWKFSNEKYDALSPNTLSKPGRRGDMKIDTNGDVYIGVVNGPTQVWKKINNA